MKLYIKESEDFEQYTYVKSKTVYDYDGFTTEYTMYYDEVNDKYVFVFGDSDFYNPNDGYEEFDWECDTEREADEWFESYKGYEDDLDESLKENVNKKYNWFLVSNNYGKTVSVLPESDCDSMIEDFVINMLFDEVVTDEADEDLLEKDPEKFYQKYDVEEQIRAAKYDLTQEGNGLKVSSGRYIIIKDSDYEGDLPYNYYIENGRLYNPSDVCVGKLENVTTKPNIVKESNDIEKLSLQDFYRWFDINYGGNLEDFRDYKLALTKAKVVRLKNNKYIFDTDEALKYDRNGQLK